MGWRFHCATTVIVQYVQHGTCLSRQVIAVRPRPSLLTRRPFVEARNKCLEAQVSSIFVSLSRALPGMVTLQTFGRSIILRGMGVIRMPLDVAYPFHFDIAEALGR
jgi:hypothetical protein